MQGHTSSIVTNVENATVITPKGAQETQQKPKQSLSTRRKGKPFLNNRPIHPSPHADKAHQSKTTTQRLRTGNSPPDNFKQSKESTWQQGLALTQKYAQDGS